MFSTANSLTLLIVYSPLAGICPYSNIWQSASEAPFIANHYMGTLESWTYRVNDARGLGWRKMRFEELNLDVGASLRDDIRPWLKGFVRSVGYKEAYRLLEGVGELEPKPKGRRSNPVQSRGRFYEGQKVEVYNETDNEWHPGRIHLPEDIRGWMGHNRLFHCVC